MRCALFLTCGLVLLTLGGCATQRVAACPAGQESMRTAQMFFVQAVGGKPGVSESDFRAFLSQELTPRFPQGLTVLEGGGKWKGEENRMLREASKVVVLVLPAKDDSGRRLKEVRKVYAQKFRQESVMRVTQPSCVAL